MIQLGNIVYNSELVNHQKVSFVNYIEESIPYNQTPDLPTLYVGFQFLKDCNSSNPTIKHHPIISKEIIGNRLYFVPSFDENRGNHVMGVFDFIENLPHYYFPVRYRYINLDPVFFQICDLDDLFNLLPRVSIQGYCYKNEMLYLFDGKNIFGIDLLGYKFFDFDIDFILRRAKILSKSFVDDTEGSIFQTYYRIFPDYEYLRRYLTVLLSKG
jgi:hypothetical protein